MSYRPEIDGLRAFAVLPVILFHFGFGWISGGYLGVDVFFVISGFLITSILIKENDTGKFSLQTFWIRRIQRILPSLIVVVATTLAFSYLFAFRGDLHLIGRQALTALLSVSNIYFWRTAGNYWGTTAEESPLLHTWSLSVEEQFYLLFPASLWIVLRWKPQWLCHLAIVAILSSLGLFVYGAGHHPSMTFYLLPARIWELSTGTYLAILFRDQESGGFTKNKTLSALALVGLSMILLSYLFVPRPNAGVTFATFGAGLVIAFGQSGFCHEILTRPIVVFTGKMSYALYLWHWPVLVLSKYCDLAIHSGILCCLIVVLAYTSYTLIEQPTRKRQELLPFVGIGYVSVLLMSCFFVLSEGIYDASEFAPVCYDLNYFDLKPRPEKSDQSRKIFATVVQRKREIDVDTYANGGLIIGKGESAPKVVVFGDSHGIMWSSAIHATIEKLNLKTSFYSMDGVSPFFTIPTNERNGIRPLNSQNKSFMPDELFLTPDERHRYDEARMLFIKQWTPDLVIICSHWSERLEDNVQDLVAFSAAHAGHVLLMEQPPELSIGNRNAAQYLCYKGIKPNDGVKKYLPTGNSEKYELGRLLINDLAATHDRVDVVSVHDLYSQGAETLVLDGKNVVYLDNDHLTTYGSQLGTDRIEQQIRKYCVLNRTMVVSD
jgi:peptidoglycan/LPS O-acetylase OafA/YrhL